jgi:hypothetical protein
LRLLPILVLRLSCTTTAAPSGLGLLLHHIATHLMGSSMLLRLMLLLLLLRLLLAVLRLVAMLGLITIRQSLAHVLFTLLLSA